MLNSKRYESGASKRKREIEKREKISKLPKLTQFFTKSNISDNPSNDGNSSTIGTSLPTSSLPANNEINEICRIESPSLNNEPLVIEFSDQESELRCLESSSKKYSTDPALWGVTTSSLQEYWIRKGPSSCQNKTADFSKSAKEYFHKNKNETRVETRHFTPSLFKRLLHNGDFVDRDWLLFSPSLGAVFCFVCKLFSVIQSPFIKDGFQDWKHANKALKEHENSGEHKKCLLVFCKRESNAGRIDTNLQIALNKEQEYWQDVLKRIVEVIKFLTARGLPLRGDNEVFGTNKNGNYLGTLELLAKFDPFLQEHIKKYGNAGRGSLSYLSPTICEEFIKIMGKKVLEFIISEIKTAKYYSISVDSTPDISHTDQLAFIIRYLQNGIITERFLKFIQIYSHGSEHLADTVTIFLNEHDIPITDCRGQSYDNASNMSGKYSGLQARIKNSCKYAEFVPCAGHSLNLVGVQAAESCVDASLFFTFVQSLYNFFSASTQRWNVLINNNSANMKTLKSLSATRWSARKDAVQCLCEGYDQIKVSLEVFQNSEEEKQEVRQTAKGLMKQMNKFEIVFLLILWNDILSKCDKISRYLQNESMDLSEAVKLLKSLCLFIETKRDMFDYYENLAKKKAGELNAEYKDLRCRRKMRSKKITFTEGNAPEEQLEGRNKFKIDVFLPIIDSLILNLKIRLTAYEKIYEKFGFLEKIYVLEDSEIEENCTRLSNFYSEDLDANELISDCVQLKYYIKQGISEIKEAFEKENSTGQMKPPSSSQEIITDSPNLYESFNIRFLYNYLNSKSKIFFLAFPNVEIAMKIFLTMMVTVAGGERSFSKLKLLKSDRRSTMCQERLNNLSIMSLENDILQKIDFTDIIKTFAESKCRKANIM